MAWLSKQSRRLRYKMPSRSLWCHCNVLGRNESKMRICIVCKCVSAVWPDPCSVSSCLPPVTAGELVHKIPWPQKCWRILHKCQGTCAKYQRPTCSPKIVLYINGRVAFPQSIPGIVWRVQKSRDYRSRFYKQRLTKFIAWMSNHILSFLEDVMIQPYSKLNSCSAKPPLNLVCARVITSRWCIYMPLNWKLIKLFFVSKSSPYV